MSTPVKTLVLDRIETVIAACASVNKAIRHPGVKPSDLDDYDDNLVFIFDDEEQKEQRNRITRKTFPLHVECWIKHENGMRAISDAADILQAEITAALQTDSSLLEMSVRVAEIQTQACASKFYQNETEGGIVLLYEVAYQHARNDLYSLEPTN